MGELLTAAQMRAIERDAMQSGRVTGRELMERAGQGVVDAILREWPDLSEGAPVAIILCGPGNNGGDGFVVARLLHQRGWQVEVFLYGDPGKLPPDAKTNYERWTAMGEIAPLTQDALSHSNAATQADPVDGIVLDAVFGTGLTRPLDREVTLAISTAQSLGGALHLVSVDCLSGFCSDSGRVLGEDVLHFETELCVTFHRMKVGHVIGDVPDVAAKVVLVDIGLERSVDVGLAGLAGHGEAAIQAASLICGYGAGIDKAQTRGRHKYDHGHALILSGGVGRGGAARLAARGALRVGAGLVSVGCPGAALIENAAQLNAIMLCRVNDAADLDAALTDARISALGLGPGLGLGDRAVGLVRAALESGRAGVLDADALTLIAADAGLFERLHDRCVLTPHQGEFARLFPDIAEKRAIPAMTGPAYSKLDATRDAAARAGCIVLFKGPDTVIAHPDGRASVNAAQYERAAPSLATAGSGDVLTGLVAGLLARGFEPMQAAESAAWLHTECALHFGPGLIAEDLPEQLPAVLSELGMSRA